MGLVAHVRTRLRVEGEVTPWNKPKRCPFWDKVIKIVENSQQPRGAAFIVEDRGTVGLTVGMHRDSGGTGIRALKEAAREYDVRSHQFCQKLNHRRMSD